MRALNDDYTSIAIRNFIERQSDLVGESLAHDQQSPGTLAEQLLAAALRDHVGVKKPPQASPGGGSYRPARRRRVGALIASSSCDISSARSRDRLLRAMRAPRSTPRGHPAPDRSPRTRARTGDRPG
jgi:hypothetical protein